MKNQIDKFISFTFATLFFLTPLVLFPYSSELFEFNKMVLVYILTSVLVFLWIVKSVLYKKFIFTRTVLDLPLLIFLASQIISTLISFDSRTSIYGYYSRFNGGVLSTLCYVLLYWIFVSTQTKDRTFYLLKVLLTSGFLVSIYAILEHFGIDKNIWVQDVQNRVFSTLGQPNWLAAWIVALMPLTWALGITNYEFSAFVRPSANRRITNENTKVPSKDWSSYGRKSHKNWLWFGLSIIFFINLLFTKSRSGILGFIVADFIFWAGNLILIYVGKNKDQFKGLLKSFVIYNLSFVTFIIIVGSPWTPNLKHILSKNLSPTANSQQLKTNSGPALEAGGTESGQIRKIVWKGAIDIWKSYPIFGTGVETFAFSYYNFRPVEHNTVSEWDFLYNKAHNEYLNFMATTGSVGLVAYMMLIGFIVFNFLKSHNKNQITKFSSENNPDINIYHFALLAGFASILVTNFFGFSVVPVSLNFFLFPAIAYALGNSTEGKGQSKSEESKLILNTSQKITISFALCTLLFVLYRIGIYWYSDILYQRGKNYNDSGDILNAQKTLGRLVELSPGEAIYWDELAQSTANIAAYLQSQNATADAQKIAKSTNQFSEKSVALSPKNVTIKRSRASILVKLSSVDANYMALAQNEILDTIKLAPTDAKLYQNLGVTYIQIGDLDRAEEIFKKTIEMKPNYKDARYALGLVYLDKKEIYLAREQFEYILKNIDPNYDLAKKELQEINVGSKNTK